MMNSILPIYIKQTEVHLIIKKYMLKQIAMARNVACLWEIITTWQFRQDLSQQARWYIYIVKEIIRLWIAEFPVIGTFIS